MILTGPEILRRILNTSNSFEEPSIKIEPFREEQLNPNSYNLTLDNKLLVYTDPTLDSKKKNPTTEITIPPEGLILQPGKLYLGSTIEYTETHNLVPILSGRSSTGRLGLFVHVTAGIGDTSFCGKWTLELVAVQPIRIYAGMPVCQIMYHTVEGDIIPYKGKYQGAVGVQASALFQDLKK